MQTVTGSAGSEDSQRAAAEMESGGMALTADKPRVQLNERQEQMIELARQQNVLVAAIAGSTWGKNMSPGLRRGYAEYCRRYDVDPLTEMDNLGGNIYVNSEWSMRKLGELRLAGVVKDFWLEHIHADPRYRALMNDELAPAALRAEAGERWGRAALLRIEHNVPENAEAACVCYITLQGGGHPIKGCKWGGGGESVLQPKSGGGTAPNPVVENNPTLSVESQCVRRAMRQLMSHVTGKLGNVQRTEIMDGELDTLNTVAVEQGHVLERHNDAVAALSPGKQRVVPVEYAEGGITADIEATTVGRDEHGIRTRIVPPRGNGGPVRPVSAEFDPYAEIDRVDANPFMPGNVSIAHAVGAIDTVDMVRVAPAGADLFGEPGDPPPVRLADEGAYAAPVDCAKCGRTVMTHSNQHDPDCPAFAD